MSLKRMICEFCYAEIGKFDTDNVKLPLSPEMFTSPDERHGIPAPFPEGQKTWLDFRCPVCMLRPMQHEHEIACYDAKGFNDTHLVTKENNLQCQDCGKIYQHRSSLYRHRSKEHGL